MSREKTDENDCASNDEVVNGEDEKETYDTVFLSDKESKKPETFVQDELNDLVKDLGLLTRSSPSVIQLSFLRGPNPIQLEQEERHPYLNE